MASEPETQNTNETPNPAILSLLAMIGGLGILLMVLAAGIGVVWENADSSLIALFVMAGAGLLIAAIGGWAIVVRPFQNFDDITVPNYHGHHHDEHEEHADDESHAEH